MCNMNLWNEKDLPVPPINTYRVSNTTIDIKHMYDVFHEGKQFFDNEQYMYAEYQVLSRIVYRMKQKFRSAKDFKALEKLNKALNNYFMMNISSNLKKFMDLIPSKYKEEIYLPTKSLLDYILVRLQGIVKLMDRVVETSKIAAYLLDKRMHIGHFWKIAFITFSLVSRVCILARYTAKFVCDFYRKLLPFSSQLKNTSSGWLPQNYTFPKDLTEWMNVDWLEFDDEVQIIDVSTEIPDIMRFFDLVDDEDDVEFCDEYFLVEDDDVKVMKKKRANKAQNTCFEKSRELRGFNCIEDIGEVIELEDSFNIASIKGNGNIAELNSSQFIEPTGNNITELHAQNTATDLVGSTNMNPYLDSLEVKEDITVSDISVQDVAEDYSKLLCSDNSITKINKSSDALSISDSDSEILSSESEDNIVTLSDNSIMEVSTDKLIQKPSQQYGTIDIENDVITISDTSLLETDKFEKRRLKKIRNGRSKMKVDVHNDSIINGNKTTAIIIPDTPISDEHIMSNSSVEKDINDSQNRLNSNRDNEETVIIIDTPIKALQKPASMRKKAGKIGKVVKRGKKLSNHKDIRNIDHAINLEENMSMSSPITKKKMKRKNNSDDHLNNKLFVGINGSKGTTVLGEDRHESLINRNKIGKSRKNKSNLKLSKSRKLELAIKSLSENNGIVNKTTNNIPRRPSMLKNKKQKCKHIDLENIHLKSDGTMKSTLQHSTPIRKKQNNIPRESLYTSLKSSHNLDTSCGSSLHLELENNSNAVIPKRKRKKKKEIYKNRQSGSPQIKIKQNNEPNLLAKLGTHKNFTVDHTLNVSKRKLNGSRKRKRYWESREEVTKTNNEPIIPHNSLSEISSNNVKKSKQQKKRKKVSNSLQQNSEIKQNTQYYDVQKSGKGVKHGRKRKRGKKRQK